MPMIQVYGRDRHVFVCMTVFRLCARIDVVSIQDRHLHVFCIQISPKISAVYSYPIFNCFEITRYNEIE